MPDIKLTEEQAKEFIDDGWLNVVCGDYRFYLELDQREKRFFYFELIQSKNGRTKNNFAYDVTELELLKPKRPRDPSYYHNDPLCPNCGTYMIYNFEHCPKCGQKLDWSEGG